MEGSFLGERGVGIEARGMAQWVRALPNKQEDLSSDLSINIKNWIGLRLSLQPQHSMGLTWGQGGAISDCQSSS